MWGDLELDSNQGKKNISVLRWNFWDHIFIAHVFVQFCSILQLHCIFYFFIYWHSGLILNNIRSGLRQSIPKRFKVSWCTLNNREHHREEQVCGAIQHIISGRAQHLLNLVWCRQHHMLPDQWGCPTLYRHCYSEKGIQESKTVQGTRAWWHPRMGAKSVCLPTHQGVDQHI